MTRKEFEVAREKALVHYLAVSESDLAKSKTERQKGNAQRRIKLCHEGLEKIKSGKFWDSFTECVFASTYQFYDPEWEVSPF